MKSFGAILVLCIMILMMAAVASEWTSIDQNVNNAMNFILDARVLPTCPMSEAPGYMDKKRFLEDFWAKNTIIEFN